MVKKKQGPGPVKPAVRHARIELSPDDYQRLQKAAKRFRLPVAAYIRLAVFERIERDERQP
jgi:hypothetical protein